MEPNTGLNFFDILKGLVTLLVGSMVGVLVKGYSSSKSTETTMSKMREDINKDVNLMKNELEKDDKSLYTLIDTFKSDVNRRLTEVEFQVWGKDGTNGLRGQLYDLRSELARRDEALVSRLDAIRIDFSNKLEGMKDKLHELQVELSHKRDD